MCAFLVASNTQAKRIRKSFEPGLYYFSAAQNDAMEIKDMRI